MVAYFSLGWLFFTRPLMRREFLKYSVIYRSQEDMKVVMPIGMLGMLLSKAIAYFIEWTVVGVVIGLIYRSHPQ